MPVRPLLTLSLLAGLAAASLGAPTSARAARPPIVPEAPTPPRGPTPTEPMTVDTSCFSVESEVGAAGGIGPGRPRGGFGTGGGAATVTSSGATYAKSAAKPSAPPPPSGAVPSTASPVAEAATVVGGSVVSSGVAQDDSAFQGFAPAAVGGAVAISAPARSEEAEPAVVERVQAPPAGARVDWGGVVHLSNDDSASLASAQRLLWALDRGASFSAAQIRPHELLNYFSFSAPKPAHGETFGFGASAQRLDGDTLQLALAVQGATPPRADLDLTLLIDRSGSMSADGRMDYTRRALQTLQGQLHAGDRVDVVLFDDEICTAVRDFVVGRDDPSVLRQIVDQIQPRGSTDLDLGLREAYRVAASHPQRADRAGRVMVFTDAILNTGDVNPDTVTEIGRHLDQRNLRLTGVGVGSDFRDDVLDKLTEKGKGAYVFLGSERVVDRLFGRGFDGLVQTLAEDVRFALDLPDSLGMERFYGEEMSRDPALVQPVNFQAGNQQLFLEDLAIRSGALRGEDTIQLTATWTDPATGVARSQAFTTTVTAALAADPHDVRKAAALMAWSDVLFAQATGGGACGAPLDAYRGRLAGLEGDAEIAYTTELLTRWCGPISPAPWTAPLSALPAQPTRMRLDSDVILSDVELSCGARQSRFALTTADRVLPLDLPAGRCDVTLHGAVPMRATVDLPPPGGEVRCVVRAGRATCT